MNDLQCAGPFMCIPVILHNSPQDRYDHPSLSMRKQKYSGVGGWEELKDDKER